MIMKNSSHKEDINGPRHRHRDKYPTTHFFNKQRFFQLNLTVA